MARRPTYGFRCAKYLDAPSADAVAPYLVKSIEVPAATAEELAAYLTHFAYARDVPLNAETLSIDCEPADADYSHDIVRIDAAYPAERFDIHLYFPRHANPPYETVVYYPGGSPGKTGTRNYPSPSARGDRRALIRTGRVVCFPIYFGHYTTPPLPGL